MIVKSANLKAIQRDSIDNKLSPNAIFIMFNEFLLEFERMEKGNVITMNIFYDAVEEITDAVLSILPRKLIDPKILHHPLLQFLSQLVISTLDKWCMSPLRINIQQMDIFLKTILVFVHVAEQLSEDNTEKDRQRSKDLLTTKQFLFKVREQIDDVVLNKRHCIYDRNIYALGLLAIKLLQGCPFYYQLGRNERLIDDLIINSLDSYDFIQVMHELENGQPLTRIERYLLSTCWEYLTSESSADHKLSHQITSIDLVHYLSDELLIRLEHALTEPPPGTPSLLAHILGRYYQLLNIHNLRSFDKHVHYIIDYLTNILQNSSPTNGSLIIVALEAFSNLTTNADIRSSIKKRHLTSHFNQYLSTHIDHQTRQLVLTILAQIMDEEDINNNPTQITATFLDQLKQLHLHQHSTDLDSVLSSLKVLMQHEQIKTEFVRQGGVDILIVFIGGGDSDKQSASQLEDALKILWSCTFNNSQILNKLQQDTKLMDRVRQLLDNASESGNNSLEKAAEGLIWKVEKEEAFKQKQADEAERKQQEKKRKAKESGIDEEEEEEEEEQYDCMISYSWADMELAHRIFHHLTEKLGYKIWLDQQQMHGSTIEAMANAVENAQFILMCMSETYKRSANCQSEAEYAFNRKKHIVPIKMKEDYTADGWLGFILGTRMYIDIGSHDFEKAIALLDNEIQLQKKKRKQAKELAKVERKAARTSENQADVKDEVSSLKIAVKNKISIENVFKWNQRNVREFLSKNRLISMIPLCDGINGEELFTLYSMCKESPSSMYRSLKFELLHGYHRILPISIFLRFMSCMRIICDDELPLTVNNAKRNDSDFFER